MEVKSNLIELEVVYNKLNKSIDENISRLTAGATAVENYNKKISVIPSEFQKSLVDIKAKTDAVATSTKSLMQAEKQANQERLKELQLQKQREQAVDKYNAQLAKEEQKLATASNMYNKVQTELNKLQFAYQNLAVKQAQGISLSKAEASQMDYLRNRIQMHDKTLKAVDATMGKYQRNVGNYASGFNPLSNSINQLTREMPAFTYSVQTGFMALSNNIPIFTDAIGNAVRQNKELIAQGKPTTSVLSQLAGAFFSWQTLMGVGITLLTVYGKEIGVFLKNVFSSVSAVNTLKESQKQLNEVSQQGAKNSVEETFKLKSLLAVAKDTTLTYKERMIAVKELQDTYPAYFGNLKEEEILAGKTALAEKELTNAILSRAKANAAVTKITENQSQIIDLEIQKLELLKEQQKLQKDVARQEKVQSGVVGGGTVAGTYDLATTAITRLASVTRSLNNINSEKASLEQINNTLTSFAIEKEKESILLRYKQEKATNANNKAKTEQIQKEEELLTLGTEAWLRKQISLLEETRSKQADNTEQYAIGTGAIKFYQQWLERLIGTQKKSNEETEKTIAYGTIPYYEKLQQEVKGLQDLVTDTSGEEYQRLQKTIDFYQALIDAIKGVKEETKELEKANTDYFDSFISQFENQSGFSKFFELMHDDFKLLKEGGATAALAISEAFQEAFNTISSASQANFDAEYNRLSMQKEIAIQFAGESSTAKEEIERQYEEKRKAIARREAESQKRLAIFNVAIDTAQAIVASIAKSPQTFGLPFSAFAAAAGIAQIAIINSQQIPQFWKGTDNAPEGYAWTQEKGAEVITDKSGNVKTMGNDKGAQLTYLNKGDKVYKSRQDYINKQLVNAGIQPMRSTIENFTQNNSLTTEDFNAGISKLAKTMQSNKGSNTQVFLNNKPLNTDYFKGKKVK